MGIINNETQIYTYFGILIIKAYQIITSKFFNDKHKETVYIP